MAKWTVFAVVLITFLVPFAGRADLDDSVLSLTSPYKKVVRKYTQERSHYSISDLNVSFKWFATYHSPTFLAAADSLLKKLYPEGLTPYVSQEKSEMDPERQTEFFLGLFAIEPGLRAVVSDKNLWDINLKVGGKIYEAATVEEVNLNPLYTTLYPYLNRWYEGYRVVFPTNVLVSGQDEMELILSSVRGTSRMEFKIR